MADSDGSRWAWAVTGRPTAAELAAATARYSARFGCFPSILLVDPVLLADGLQAPMGVRVEAAPHMGRGLIAFAVPGDDAATGQEEEAAAVDQGGNGIDAAIVWGGLDAVLEEAEQLSFAEWFFAPRVDGGAVERLTGAAGAAVLFAGAPVLPQFTDAQLFGGFWVASVLCWLVLRMVKGAHFTWHDGPPNRTDRAVSGCILRLSDLFLGVVSLITIWEVWIEQ